MNTKPLKVGDIYAHTNPKVIFTFLITEVSADAKTAKMLILSTNAREDLMKTKTFPLWNFSSSVYSRLVSKAKAGR